MAINDYLRTSSLDIYDSVSYKNLKQRKLYSDLLLGRAARADVGQDAEPNNLTARPPSWTQHGAGLSHGFVAPAISSSQHEKQVLNAFVSGTVALESSPVPASGTVFYSKTSRFVKVTYKVTGSADWPTGFFGRFPGALGFDATSGTLLDSGSTSLTPFVVPFDVTQRGKIVDVKVWIETISRSGSEGILGPLSVFGLALKSPNVRFENSIPIMNDKTIVRTGTTDYYFFKNTYLLWVGAQLDDAVLSIPTTADDYYTWNRDRHMRTVFTDSAHPLDGYNPRNLASSHGGFFASVTASSPLGNYATNAPNGSKIGGNDWPWISDARVQEGGNHGAAGSPPDGWLTGPGGTAADNEWATTGSNFGPAYMRPMYPLLDDVLEEKCVESVSREGSYSYSEPSYRDTRIASRRGIRPGLRGTEAQGRWELLIVTQDPLSVVPVIMTYFRQARLELTLDVGQGLSRVLPRKRGIEARKSPKPVAIMSGAYNGTGLSSVFGYATNKFRNIVYTVPQRDVGTTVGITDDTGSLANGDFAVFCRVTGALGDVYASASMAHARYVFLNNEFGTPFIPLSSGSGKNTFEQLDPQKVRDIITPSFATAQFLTLPAIMGVTKPNIQAAARAYQIVSGSS